MPPERARHQRYFPPPIARVLFRREALPHIVPLTMRRRFGFDNTSTGEVQGARTPKPPGEVSRLSRGGYSLQAALGWDNREYQAFKVSTFRSTSLPAGPDKLQNLVSDLANEHLRPDVTLAQQDDAKVEFVCQEVCIRTLYNPFF
jgi:hypothetical protein